MADIEKLIPHLLKWEASTADPKLSNVQLFNNARARGFVNDPDDSGGATMIGVTLRTYTDYRKKKNLPKPTVKDLKAISYEEWKEILKSMYWDRFKADQIENQSIANLCVDWLYMSGVHAIKNTQQCLKLVNDGIVGAKTVAALNADDPSTVFKKIWKKRRDFYYGIAANRPTQQKFLRGWLNRLNDCKYGS